VWRVQNDGSLHSHTGQSAAYRSAWLDEQGRLFVDTALGFGIVHTLDMEPAANAIEAGRWQTQEVRFAELPQRFHYALHPVP
jgi:hypothetical protein